VDLRASLDVSEKRKRVFPLPLFKIFGYSAHSLSTAQSAVSPLTLLYESTIASLLPNHWTVKLVVVSSCYVYWIYLTLCILFINFILPSSALAMGFVWVVLNPLGSATAFGCVNCLCGGHTGIIECNWHMQIIMYFLLAIYCALIDCCVTITEMKRLELLCVCLYFMIQYQNLWCNVMWWWSHWCSCWSWVANIKF
jgi:hypothetical protein